MSYRILTENTYQKALAICKKKKEISKALLQYKLRISYIEVSECVDRLIKDKIVAYSDGSNSLQVLDPASSEMSTEGRNTERFSSEIISDETAENKLLADMMRMRNMTRSKEELFKRLLNSDNREDSAKQEKKDEAIEDKQTITAPKKEEAQSWLKKYMLNLQHEEDAEETEDSDLEDSTSGEEESSNEDDYDSDENVSSEEDNADTDDNEEEDAESEKEEDEEMEEEDFFSHEQFCASTMIKLFQKNIEISDSRENMVTITIHRDEDEDEEILIDVIFDNNRIVLADQGKTMEYLDLFFDLKNRKIQKAILTLMRHYYVGSRKHSSKTILTKSVFSQKNCIYAILDFYDCIIQIKNLGLLIE